MIGNGSLVCKMPASEDESLGILGAAEGEVRLRAKPGDPTSTPGFYTSRNAICKK